MVNAGAEIKQMLNNAASLVAGGSESASVEAALKSIACQFGMKYEKSEACVKKAPYNLGLRRIPHQNTYRPAEF